MFAGASPEETERRVGQWSADFAAKANRYQTMQEQISRVSATEQSADGAVQVTVDSGGVVTDLVLSDRANQLSPRRLASQILDVMRRAQSRLTGQVQQVMQRTVGDDQSTVQAVVGSYEQRFPEPPPPEPPRYGGDLRIGQVEDDRPPPSQYQRPPDTTRPRRMRNPRDDEDEEDDSIYWS
jgi:DNA-binding protein YbaB